MDRAQFWQLIEATKSESKGDCERQAELLRGRLARLPATEIAQFSRTQEELLNEAYTWELWAAAFLINGGCSDDGFEYFRGWLMAQGERLFTAAVKDPDSLAEFPGAFPEYAECEEMTYVANQAYEEKTGGELPSEAYVPLHSTEPRGKRWEEGEEGRVCPRLAARIERDQHHYERRERRSARIAR